MWQENLVTLARAQAAYNRGDWDAALATVDPNVVFDVMRVAPDGQIYEGHEGGRRSGGCCGTYLAICGTDPEEVDRRWRQTVLTDASARQRKGKRSRV